MNDTVAVQPATPSSPLAGWRREKFEFRGTAREYFGIWIVNVLLTIVTLGIYSAWAKVRRQRYFYGNTWLADASFEYHARPMPILFGRIVVVIILVAYNLAVEFMPLVGGLIAIAFLFALPWFIMRGLRFNARVTSYRNVRFDFTGGYGGAFLAYVLGGALIYGSAGILAPLASQWMWSYTLGNLRYGDRPIKCDPRLEKLFGQLLLPAIVLVVGLIVVGTVMVAAVVAFLHANPDMFEPEAGGPSPYLILIAVYLVLVPFLILYFFAGLIYRAGTRNVAFNETVVDGRHLLASSIHRGRYVWIAFTNILATLGSLGLARPWAAVRMARYTASVTALDATTSLDEYVGTLRDEGAAVGSEYMDVEGFDFGF
ncbi:MAG: YjgN family protein [Rhizobiaceae bacterium]